MKIRWVCEAGIVENMPRIVKEYRETRKLLVSNEACKNSSIPVSLKQPNC